MLEWLAGVIGAKKAVIIAGFFGALVSLSFVREASSLGGKLTLVACGFAGACYGAPAMAEWMDVGTRVENGLAFAMGLLFMSLAGAIIGAIKDAKLGEAIATWFRKPGS